MKYTDPRITGRGMLLVIFGAFLAGSCNMSSHPSSSDASQPEAGPENVRSGAPGQPVATATFGSGCFWCTEAVFQELEGIKSVKSGYSGGKVENPTYDEVCSGTTGHAEVIQVEYDPNEVSYEKLLEVFWKTHDPTTPNRQGNDVGTQYRSVIFYHDEKQRELAEHYKQKLDGSGAFDAPIVTEISPLTKFYPAEDYHQNYYRDNSSQPYCAYVIAPKLEKFRKTFQSQLKE
jgi:peptide-methionine (S)-S-oxide reductase